MDSEANLPSHRWLTIACTFGLMHAVVDATSVSVLVWGVRTTGNASGPMPYDVLWSRYLLYNVLAFGTQFAIGAIADRWRAYRGTLLAGLAMIAVAVGVELVSPQAANMLAALGNAAFHVGAGAVVLSVSAKKTAPAGVFVGPGAVGLAFGFWSAQSNLGPWIFLGPLALCAALAVALRNVAQQGRAAPRPPLSLSTAVAVICVGAILLAVAIRSAGGFEVGTLHEGETAVLWGLALAACAGNILGGLAADRCGWLATCVVVLLLSLPILGFFVDRPAVAILGMLLFRDDDARHADGRLAGVPRRSGTGLRPDGAGRPGRRDTVLRLPCRMGRDPRLAGFAGPRLDRRHHGRPLADRAARKGDRLMTGGGDSSS